MDDKEKQLELDNREQLELNNRLRLFNNELITLLGKYKLTLGAIAFITKDGTIAANPYVFNDSKKEEVKIKEEIKKSE